MVLTRQVHIGGSDGELTITKVSDAVVKLEFEERQLNILQPSTGWIFIQQGSDMYDLIRENIIDFPTASDSRSKTVKKCRLKIKFNERN
jgi:hypothetical protein